MTPDSTRQLLSTWQQNLTTNCYQSNKDIKHSVQYYFPNTDNMDLELSAFGAKVAQGVEPMVQHNDERDHLPKHRPYDGIGQRIDQIDHHPIYEQIGNIIYASDLMAKIAKPGELLPALLLFFISSHAGEAGHNCPIACSAGLIRVLTKHPELHNQAFYLKKLTTPSYTDNYTGAQFLTEIQGGSDVGANCVQATMQADGSYTISGEKWFCSNAHANLILLTARFDNTTPGTKGLGLFLLPAVLANGTKNHMQIRRLKEKIGTRTMASAEIDFTDAIAYPIEPIKEGFKTVMRDVLNISRIFNTFNVIGMGRRALQIASSYARYRNAFNQPIIEYPLVQQHLARIKVENSALMAAACATAHMQDQFDCQPEPTDQDELWLRLLININKTVSALWSVDHIHHSIDVLAGNGAIETFSSLPRLLRDSIVCENWEGTHNTLYMQILRDIHKFNIDQIYFENMHKLQETLNPSEDRQFLNSKLNDLQSSLAELKQEKPNMQTLRIKEIINGFFIIFASTQLLKEAQNESMMNNSNNKYLQWQYFNSLHLSVKTTNHNELSLIYKILDS